MTQVQLATIPAASPKRMEESLPSLPPTPKRMAEPLPPLPVTPQVTHNDFLHIFYEDCKFLVVKPRTYADIIQAARRKIVGAADREIILRTEVDGMWAGSRQSMSPDVWPALLGRGLVQRVWVELGDKLVVPPTPPPPPPPPPSTPQVTATQPDPPQPTEDGTPLWAPERSRTPQMPKSPKASPKASPSRPPPRRAATVDPDVVRLNVEAHVDGQTKTLAFKLRTTQRLERVALMLRIQLELTTDDELLIVHDGRRLVENDTPAGVGLTHGAALKVFVTHEALRPLPRAPAPRGPEMIKVSLSVALTPHWDFAALYPDAFVTVAPAPRTYAQRVTWHVSLRTDNSLFHQATDAEVSSIYWGALSGLHVPDSPTAPDAPAFDAARATLSQRNSVTLAHADVPAYLEAALLAQGLSARAIVDFVAYWQPRLARHTHVALRVLPPELFEPAAPLSVTPRPLSLTRACVVFRGLNADELVEWRGDALVVYGGAKRWVNVVSLERDEDNPAMFRVLDTGGLEILPDHEA